MKKSIFKSFGLILALMLALGSLFGCSKSEKIKSSEKTETTKEEVKASVELNISAAASLTEALNEIKPMYESETGNKLTFNFGASGALQKQIEEGAPSDVFISAGKKQVDALKTAGLLQDDSIKDLLGNKLVLIVSKDYKDKITKIEDLANTDGKIAIGEVETVPVGQYSKESLENLNIWSTIQDKLVFAKDVKSVLAYVESGEAAAGIVYKSDAYGIKDAAVAQEIDSATHKEIVYPEAIIKASKNAEAAKEFMEFLSQDSSKAIFEKYGFIVK